MSENDDHDKNCSSSDDNDDDDYEPTSTFIIDKYFSDKPIETSDDDDDDDGDESDIENQYISTKYLIRSNRLSTILRQTNKLVEIKLNIHRTNPTRRLYIPTSILVQYQTDITRWLQASTCLIDEISTSIYHRHCWSQLLLTYFIEQQFVNLQFHVCTQQHISSIHHQHVCIPEEDAYKLTAILQKGSKFHINSNIFDNLRRIIVIKSLQENKFERENSLQDHTNLQQLYVKQITNLKQCLINEQSSLTNRTHIYSKVLLFLSSLYSIKSETMQTLFCQHLLHNPTYSYLINS